MGRTGIVHNGEKVNLRSHKTRGRLLGVPTITDQLRKAITTSGMTQAELSRASGVAESQLSRFRDGGELRTGNVDRLCSVLGLVLTTKTGRKARKER